MEVYNDRFIAVHHLRMKQNARQGRMLALIVFERGMYLSMTQSTSRQLRLWIGVSHLLIKFKMTIDDETFASDRW